MENGDKEKTAEEIPSKETTQDSDEETDALAAARPAPEGKGKEQGDDGDKESEIRQANGKVEMNGSAPSGSAQSSPDEGGDVSAATPPLNTSSISSIITASEKVGKFTTGMLTTFVGTFHVVDLKIR